MNNGENIPPPRVLAILAERIEKRIRILEDVRLDGYSVAICELRIVAVWLRRARDYLNARKI